MSRFGGLILVLWIAACARHDPAPQLTSARACETNYEQQIAPIVAERCLSCHPGGISADKYALAAQYVAARSMPPASRAPLSEAELEAFRLWAAAGHPA